MASEFRKLFVSVQAASACEGKLIVYAADEQGDRGVNFPIVEAPDAAYAERMITPAQIRAARALLGWSQTDLADASGVAVITIKNIERGATDPKTGTVAKLEQAFERAGVFLQEPGDHRAKGQSVGFAERDGPKSKG